LPVILLTDPINPDQAQRLAQSAEVRLLGEPGVGSLSDELTAADIVIVRRNIPAEDVRKAKRLRALVRHGVGLDFIPVETASSEGIAVTNTPGCNEHSVAEHVFGMVLGLMRDIAVNDREIRASAWGTLRAAAPTRRELRGSNLGLIGFGSIGKAVAEIGHFGFGMTIMATRRSTSPGPDWVWFRPLDDVLRNADILVVACPLTPETDGLISRHSLQNMRPDSILVNIARGPVVDETALADALQNSKIGGACFDVFATQPLPASSPLRSTPRTLLSPHVAGVTRDSMIRMSQTAANDCLLMLNGQRLRNLCNSAAWSTISARWLSLSAAD